MDFLPSRAFRAISRCCLSASGLATHVTSSEPFQSKIDHDRHLLAGGLHFCDVNTDLDDENDFISVFGILGKERRQEFEVGFRFTGRSISIGCVDQCHSCVYC